MTGGETRAEGGGGSLWVGGVLQIRRSGWGGAEDRELGFQRQPLIPVPAGRSSTSPNLSFFICLMGPNNSTFFIRLLQDERRGRPSGHRSKRSIKYNYEFLVLFCLGIL